jgi:hypothetical protein
MFALITQRRLPSKWTSTLDEACDTGKFFLALLIVISFCTQ